MHRLRILLVDDSQADLELAAEAFAEHEQEARLVVRESATEALAYLHDLSIDPPDVVVLDVNMPEMSGLELLRVVKADPILHDLPVVMLSSSASPRDVQQAYTLHASSYLVKAHRFPKFLQQVDDFIRYWCQCRLLRERPDTMNGSGAQA